MPDDLATRRQLRETIRSWNGGRRRRVEIGDLVIHDPTGVPSQVHGVWQDGAYTRVLVELANGPGWVLSSDCTVTRGGEASNI